MIYETTTKGSDVVPEPVNETSARKFMTGRTPAELDTPPVSIIEPWDHTVKIIARWLKPVPVAK